MAAFVWNNISFREAGLWISPRSAIGGNAQRITAQYLVDWTDRIKAETALLGTTVRRVAGALPYLSRYVPHPHPAYPYLYASEVTLTEPEGTVLGVPDANRVATFTDARMTCQYTRLPYEIVTDPGSLDPATVPSVPRDVIKGTPWRYVIRKAPVAKEKQLTWKEGSWQFLDTGLPVTGVESRSYTLCTLSWTWIGVPFEAVDRLKILSYCGFLNFSAFDGYPRGTLLLRAPLFEVGGLPDGQRSLNITFVADYNPLFGSWQSAPDPLRSNNFFPIGRLAAVDPDDGTGVVGSGVVATPYYYVEFNDLFLPA